MMVRLGFAVAAHLEPEILVVDEVLAVGDAEFQKKAIGKMQDVSRGGGRTVLFVSHNMRAVRNLCKSSVVLENGRVAFIGNANQGIDYYLQSSSPIDTNSSIATAPRSSKCSGKIRFTDLKFLNQEGVEGNPHCGRPVVVRLTYKAIEDCTNCQIAVSFCDLYGSRILVCSSDLTMSSFPVEKGHHTIDLILPRLPLSPGEYLLALGFWENGATSDFLEYSQKLTVVDDDFYGTGKMVGSMFSGKIVLCDHMWRFL
jgi:lipopolysaccharide transport system ATP-binding protein